MMPTNIMGNTCDPHQESEPISKNPNNSVHKFLLTSTVFTIPCNWNIDIHTKSVHCILWYHDPHQQSTPNSRVYNISYNLLQGNAREWYPPWEGTSSHDPHKECGKNSSNIIKKYTKFFDLDQLLTPIPMRLTHPCLLIQTVSSERVHKL